MFKILSVFLSLSIVSTCAFAKTSKVEALYKSLQPNNIRQHFAFYELYPDTIEGLEALKQGWGLLHLESAPDFTLPKIDIETLIKLVNQEDLKEEKVDLKEKDLKWLESLTKNLANRKLKTFGKWEMNEFLEAKPEEIDLARALFVADLGNEKEAKEKIQLYEIGLDIMALQILSKLPKNPTNLDKVKTISEFIFFEMRFRFPPHSLHTEHIDTYTFLPSVMDNRRGVCLGVSILYLSLAQRLDLPLQAITPPGHIYVRYKEKDGYLNIETTARGIHVDSEEYMGIETKKLQTRTIKEVVGLAFMNKATIFWQKQNYTKAIELYLKAEKFMPADPLIEEFLGYNYLFNNQLKEGKKLLIKLKNKKSAHSVSNSTIIEDYLNKKVDVEGIKTIYLQVDETRESIIEKQKKLQGVIKKYPKYRMGLLQLASTWMQLGRLKEAKKILEQYIAIDDREPIVNYYLSLICFERFDYRGAWKYFHQTKKELAKQHFHPKVFQNLQDQLKRSFPDPNKS